MRPWFSAHGFLKIFFFLNKWLEIVSSRDDFSVFIYYRANSTFNSNISIYPAFLAATPFLHFSHSSAATPQFLLHLFNQILLTLH
jgi:hypothetical protein